MQESEIDVAGIRLRHRHAGEGPTVLFLHDAAGVSWDPLLGALSTTCRVIAPEHPGFGRGPIPEWMLSTGDVAFFYLDALPALDLREVHLVGHGLGGWIAAEIAIRSTARLASLTLLAPAGVESPDAPFDDIFAWTADEFARRQFHDKRLADEWRQAQARLDIDIVLQNRTALARLAWNPRLNNPQLPYWLHRIDIPTLLVWGEDDQVIPFACHKPYLREIRQAELLALPQTGHALPIERAGEVAARLKSFFQGTKR
ncbi:MAG TPA: alpha/beta fold hydrolase [Xanthobacteraceae bacterium]|nr:alpha/beta fold hydrolase [Xanthobacteraceae bacterium]